MEITELKNAITGIKNSLDWLNSRVEMREDTISEHTDRTKEFNQSKQRENRLGGGGEHSLENLWTIITKDPTFLSSEFQRREMEWGWKSEYSKKCVLLGE